MEHHKFLYISFIFPPLAGAEPRHNLSVIRKLYSKGFLPTIVTAPEDYQYPKDEYLRSLIPNDVEIKRCSWSYKHELYINKARELIGIPENGLMFRGWKHLYETAQKEIDKEKYEFIYSVHGIGAAHLAALKLKRETGLPWIAEFRDPWFHNVIRWDYMKDKSWKQWYSYQHRKTRRHTSEVLKHADLVIVESPMHGDFLVRDFKIDKEEVLSLGMGYEEDYFKNIEQVPIEFTKRPVIGFVGTVYYGYEYAIENFVKALKKLEDEGYEFTLICVGDTSTVFSKYANKINLNNFLPISRVEYPTALSLMNNMDFGVVIASKDYLSWINSKIWEYLRSNLSILGIVPEDGVMAKTIEDGKCGYLLPYDAESVYPILKGALKDYQEGRTKRADYDFVKNFSREKMVGELVKEIEKIL